MKKHTCKLFGGFPFGNNLIIPVKYEKYMKKFRILREQKQNKLKRIEFCLKLRPAHL